MIRRFVVQVKYDSHRHDSVARGECGGECVCIQRGSKCPHLVRYKTVSDPRKGITTADLRRYVEVVCAETKEEKVALELMED